jgi:uncharacterized protein YjiS (DUF1127 family)
MFTDPAGLFDCFRLPFRVALHRLRRWTARVRAHSELSCIDERLLDDSGLTRDNYFDAAAPHTETRSDFREKHLTDHAAWFAAECPTSVPPDPADQSICGVKFLEGVAYGWAREIKTNDASTRRRFRVPFALRKRQREMVPQRRDYDALDSDNSEH